ncbi:MAG: HAD-IB family phosphatase [Planctomycetota bacterium]
MGTVVLDFDSTLVPVESLEVYAGRRLGGDRDLETELREITRLGMEGRLPFATSLARRLAIVAPERAGLAEVGEDLARELSAGATETVAALAAAGHECWIVSGAFVEVLRPAARRLGIPEDRVLGLRARWDDAGAFAGFAEGPPFHRSKVEGLRALGPSWPLPRVGVGDGATDLALLEEGLVDAFVLYVEHQRRESMLRNPVPTAASMAELLDRLRELLEGAA